MVKWECAGMIIKHLQCLYCMFSPFDSPNSSYYDGYNPTYLGHKEKRKQVPSTLGKYYFQ